jgi:uncharacterized membrane protein YphA (DoxX/SURF4 family)
MKVLIKFLSHPGVLGFFKVSLGLLFILSSLGKIIHPAKLMDAIEAYKMVPEVFVRPMAIVIPWLQTVAGLCLLFDIYAQSAAFVVSGLLVMYTVAIAQAFARGFDIECGCFDLVEWMESKVGWFPIIRDLFLLGMSGSIFLFDRNTVNIYGLAKKIFRF